MFFRPGLIVLAAALAFASKADAVELQPHRAVYSMGLVGTPAVGGPQAVRGVMLYEMNDTCDGWKIDTKVMLRTMYGGEEEVENVRNMTTWEAKDGLGFRYRMQETHGGGQEAELIAGVAVLDEPGGPGVAEYSEPQDARVELPRGSLFPTAHLVQLIQRSIAGPGSFAKVVFDGSTTEEPYDVSALIVPAPDLQLSQDVVSHMGLRSRWLAHFAYFPTAKRSETPEFELSVVYRDDGIVEDIRQDYGDHVVDARLRQIDFLPKASCDGAPPPAPPTQKPE